MEKIMTRIIGIVCGCLLAMSVQGQELNCQVNLNYDQLFSQQKTDFSYFNQLKGIITELMNTRRWTNDQFQPSERINCTLNINLLKSTQQGVFEGTAQIIITRPVYGTNLQTTIFSYVDRQFNIAYLPTTPVFFSDNAYSDELTAILGFYANIILAVDYDTFSRQGGDPYIQRAFTIMNLAQAAAGAGWAVGGNKLNRYYLIENLQGQQFQVFREGIYTYHRVALDNFTANPIQSRKTLLDLLITMRKIQTQISFSVLMNSFLDAKSEEFINVLYEGTLADRKRAFDLLAQLDPGKTEAYRKLLY
ncbi:MAG: DUF4835 family protein [Rudanella sp.]|nr:DUF4835 family protein [Rudanella sp.]